jgi:transcriptional regulator
MPRREPYRNRIDLLQGTLDLIILQTLRWGPQHGYGISHAINANSREAFKVETGSLYPALHRLEKRGWIASEWRTSDNKQRAKYYRLTAAGKKHLTNEQSRWAQFVEAMASLMNPSTWLRVHPARSRGMKPPAD